MADKRSDTESKVGSSGWHIALERASKDGGSHYLGDVAVVDGLLRAFAFDIIDRQAAVAAGALPQGEAVRDDTARAKELAAIFSGRSADYVPMPAFHPGGLAAWIRQTIPDRLDPEGGDDHAINAAMSLFIAEIYIAVQMQIDGRSDEDCRFKLDATIEDWTCLMLGIPPEDGAGPEDAA